MKSKYFGPAAGIILALSLTLTTTATASDHDDGSQAQATNNKQFKFNRSVSGMNNIILRFEFSDPDTTSK